jgi:integrase/recombinase XerD
MRCPDAFLKILKRIAVRAGLNPEEYHPHRFRKTWATEHYRHGTPLKVIQQQLGHKNLNTTSIYLESVGAESQEMQQRADEVFSNFATP